jgi:hypothetical protein
MADRVRKASYCYVKVPHRPGRGATVLGALADAGVNLLAYSGFPAGEGKAQLDFIVDSPAAVRRVAKRHGLRTSGTKRCFLIQGDDRVGAAHRHFAKLAKARVNVTAAEAVTAGKKRFGMILWVKPRDYARASKALGAR